MLEPRFCKDRHAVIKVMKETDLGVIVVYPPHVPPKLVVQNKWVLLGCGCV